MKGAIIGDIVGSPYEKNNIKTKRFPLFGGRNKFTDDTVMTCAVAEALLKYQHNKKVNFESNLIAQMQKWGRKYIDCGFGSQFLEWIKSDNPMPYGSFGNGAAMRISPVPYFARDIDEVISLSERVTSVTHNNKEAIKGAEATAVCIWLALEGKTKREIKSYIQKHYYSLDFDYDNLVRWYGFQEGCDNTVPQAIYCFLISKNFEDALKTAVSIGGDSDTLCSITGSIAEAYYGVPTPVWQEGEKYIQGDMERLINAFDKENAVNSHLGLKK